MKILSLFLMAILLCGCNFIAKPAPKTTYFTLGGGELKTCEKEPKRTLYVEPARAFEIYERFDVFKVEKDGKIYPFEGIRFISLPSEMLQQNLILAINNQCKFKPVFERDKLSLRANLLMLEVRENEAKISIMFSMFDDYKEVKTTIISSEKRLENESEEGVMRALNLTFNEIIAKFLQELINF